MKNKNVPQHNSQKSIIRAAAHYSGPIPPPEMLEKYNQIIPGAAERILKMAEDQSAHRQYLEKKVIGSDIINSRLGIGCALIVSIATFYLAYYAIKNGSPTGGTIIGTLGIGSLVTTFIYGTKSRKDERENREVQQ